MMAVEDRASGGRLEMHRFTMQMLGMLLLVATGCGVAPQAQTGAQDSRRDTQTPKTVIWAVQQEPTDVTALSGLGGTRGPTSAFRVLSHARLVSDDYTLTPYPDLAVELPSVDRGTWRVNPDGTMETIWKLRPNIKWHDGTPFSASDVVFWFNVIMDPNIPSTSLIGLDQIVSATAIDPTTVSIRWSQPYFEANRIPDVGPIPQHILESVWAQHDLEAFLNNRYFSTDFVGLGPYRLTGWQQGSQIEFARFDDYFRGRPAIDRIILRIIPDFNTTVSNVLAGTVDIAQPPAENMDVVMDLSRRWEGTGNRARTDPNNKMRVIYMQYRPEFVRPQNGITNRTVRQGLYQAIDRPAMAQVITEGLSPVADSWFAPSDPARKDVEATIPQFPYDPNRAVQLLAEAGWVRGGDGILARSDGERFEMQLRNRPGSATEREVVVVNDYWKSLGVAGSVVPATPSQVNDREWLATYPGVQISRLEAPDAYNTRRTHSRTIAGPANRWAGRNGAAYSNPAADALQDRLVVTIDKADQITLQRQLLQEMMGEVAFMPLYWDVELALVARTVKGDVSAVETGWNVLTWDKD
jgi:peptide/nickel transport system substrate-binding protein